MPGGHPNYHTNEELLAEVEALLGNASGSMLWLPGSILLRLLHLAKVGAETLRQIGVAR